MPTLVRLRPTPGFNTMMTQTQNTNGWSDCNLVRWRQGLVEKLGGWVRLFNDGADGFIRRMNAWQDLSNNHDLLLGTDAGAQLYINDTLFPVTFVTRSASGGLEGTALASFTVTNGSAVVTVGVPDDFQISVGENITLAMPVSIGRRLLPTGSTFTVTVVGSNFFKFNMPLVATLTQTAVPGIPLFTFDWISNLATVTLNNHGQTPGSTFTVDARTFGSTPVGQYPPGQIDIPAGARLSVVTAATDTFTFDWVQYGDSGAVGNTLSLYEGTFAFGGTVAVFSTVFFVGGNQLNSPISDVWYLDNLGQDGLMVFEGSPLFVVTPPQITAFSVGTSTSPSTGPQINTGMLVGMPQAQVIVWGTEAIFGTNFIDPLLVRWSDAGTYDVWTAAVDNQAGSYRLSRGSKIVGGIQAPQTTLLFTDLDAWSMSYQGPPLVYGFTIVGTNCGLLAPHAVASVGRTTYWLSRLGFWAFGEGGVRPITCPIWDTIFNDLDLDNIQFAHMGGNTGMNEVTLYYPSLQDKTTVVPTNLLLYSQIFSNNVAWQKSAVTITDGFTDPRGGLTAERLTEQTVLAVHEIRQILNKARTSVTYTLSVYVHKNSSRWGQLHCDGIVGGAISGNGVSLFFNPITGGNLSTATNGTGWTIVTSGATTDSLATGIAGNGWLRYYITFTTDSAPQITTELTNAIATTLVTFYNGVAATGLIAWGMQLNLDTLADYEAQTISPNINNPTRYAKYNVVEQVWDFGQLTRTAWLDNNIFGNPLGADANYRVQQHEMGYDDDDGPMRNVFAETGYGTISDGNIIMSVDQCQPDLKWFGLDGGVDVILKGVRYPQGPTVEMGPFSMTPTTQFFSTRLRAKQMAVRFEWNALKGYSARIEAMAFRVKPTGTRP